MGLGIAIKAFSAALFDKQKAAQIQRVLAGQAALVDGRDQLTTPPAAARPPAAAKPRTGREGAVTLLATLQREARLIDLIREDLAQYSDAQVGSAARPCLKQCAGAISRMFDLQPLVDAGEGESVEVSGDASPIRYQWIGEGSAASGKLIHHGWQVTKIDLPTWTGADADANVVAPAQVQAP
jgi:hypothetical protein